MPTYILNEIALDINSGCSVYICSIPRSMRRELTTVFPNIDYFKGIKAREKNIQHNVLALIVVQITAHDMVEHSVTIQKERDESLHIFYKICQSLQQYLSNKWKPNDKSNHEKKEQTKQMDDHLFMDAIDPMTGQSMFSQAGPSIYDEVDGGSRLLKWNVQKYQFCGVLCHPKHGSHIYPATIFTNHKMETLTEFLKEIDGKSVVLYAKKKVSGNKYDEKDSSSKCC
eukprot:236537_1